MHNFDKDVLEVVSETYCSVKITASARWWMIHIMETLLLLNYYKIISKVSFEMFFFLISHISTTDLWCFNLIC